MDTNLNLSSTCFTVQNNKIVEGTLRDFERFIEIEPTPHGIERKFFIKSAILKQFSDDMGHYLDFVNSPSVNDDVVWSLFYWQGGAEYIVFTFDDEQSALSELERNFAYDILNNNEIFIHLNRESAENELSDSLEDQTV